MSNIPEAERVMDDLSGLFPVVNTALEQGTFQAKEYFKNLNKAIDKFLAPGIVRYHTKMILQRDGREVFEEYVKFQIDQIPNNGLCFQYNQYWIRILKSPNGELPSPGQSKTKQAFYSQKQNLFEFSSSEKVKKGNINLLLTWETDSNYELRNLTLAYPKSVNTITESVEIHWRCEIPKSKLHATPMPRVETEELEVRDLDFVIKQPIVQKRVNLNG